MISIRKKVFLLMVLFFVSAQDVLTALYMPKKYNYKVHALELSIVRMIKKRFSSSSEETYKTAMSILRNMYRKPSKSTFGGFNAYKLNDRDIEALESIRFMMYRSDLDNNTLEAIVKVLHYCMDMKIDLGLDENDFFSSLADCLYTSIVEHVPAEAESLQEKILSDYERRTSERSR